MPRKAITQAKKLYRSRNERVLAGVCGGIGEYFHLDPTLVRLFFIAISIFGGWGIVVYILMWLIVPQQ